MGDGVESVGQYKSINDAINALPDAGGEVCILPGRYFENVFIQGKRDIVLRGCGWQTRIASRVAATRGGRAGGAPPVSGAGGSTASSSSSSTFAAVITVTTSQHVKLLSFAVEAAKDEVGILLDGTASWACHRIHQGRRHNSPLPIPRMRSVIIEPIGVIDVTIEDLVITASTMPAVLAARVTLLQMQTNRMAMENVASKWPAIWVSGIEMRLVHNWVGIQSLSADREWLPVTVQGDLSDRLGRASSSAGERAREPGGHPDRRPIE